MMFYWATISYEDYIKNFLHADDWRNLFFARNSSTTPFKYVDVLNTVGDTGGLEMLDMYLLGYTLYAKIYVYRISHPRDEDFMPMYPASPRDNSIPIYIVATDDRHYNTLTRSETK